ncbi:hypothetical protein BaRGS_00038070 [Batillaria attramentaria]|uniref:Uncharacterized protein n=1 Tax=Batillaria attramentaria TaxID=370345 RepID=A0ABD0J6W5_9CAEN
MLTTGRSPRFQTGQHSLRAQTEIPAAEHERGIPLQGILMDGCPANVEPDHPSCEAQPEVPARKRERELPLEGMSIIPALKLDQEHQQQNLRERYLCKGC